MAKTSADFLALASREEAPPSAQSAPPPAPEPPAGDEPPPPDPDPKTPADPPADPAADPDADPEDPAVKGTIREIARLREDRRALKSEKETLTAQLAEREKELAELKQATQAPAPGTGPAGVDLAAQHQQTESALKSTRKLMGLLAVDAAKVEQTLRDKGFKVTNASGEEDWSAASVYEFLAAAEENLTQQGQKLLDRRNQLSRAAQESVKTVMELVPTLKDEKHPHHLAYREVIRANPWLHSHANHPEVVAAYLLGKELLDARRTGKAPAPKPDAPPAAPPPPRLPGSGNSAPATRPPGKEQKIEAARKAAQAGEEAGYLALARG